MLIFNTFTLNNNASCFYAGRSRPAIIRSGLLVFCLACISLLSFSQLSANTYYQAGKRAYSGRNYAKAIELLNKAYRANPSNGNALFYIARSYEDQRQRGRATTYYQRAVRLHMDHSLKEQAFWKIVLYHKHRQDWENLYEYSNLFLRFKDIGQVRRMRDEAESRRDPAMTQIKAIMREAQENRKAGKISAARRQYRKVLQIKSSFKPARWALALLAMKEEDYGDAQTQLNWLIQHDEPSWEYHYKRAICQYRQGRYNAALEDVSTARRLNSKPGKSFNYFTNYIEGLIYNRQMKWDKARDHLKTALRYKKKSATLLGNLALAEVLSGNLEEGEKQARRALKEDSQQHEARFALAEMARRKGSYSAYGHARLLLKELQDSSKKADRPLSTPLMLYLGKQATLKKDYKTAITAYELVDVPRLMEIGREARQKSPALDPIWDYNYHYGVSLMHDKQLNRALNVLQKLEKKTTSLYLVARVYALLDNATYARKHLLEAHEKSAEGQAEKLVWQRAEQDEPFQKLMQNDADFASFIKLRGKDPEPEVKTPEANPGLETNPETSRSDSEDPAAKPVQDQEPAAAP